MSIYWKDHQSVTTDISSVYMMFLSSVQTLEGSASYYTSYFMHKHKSDDFRSFGFYYGLM